MARKGFKQRKVFIDKDFNEVGQAHYSVLQSTEPMQPYMDEHLDIIRAEINGHTEDWVMKQHKHRFTTWFKELNLMDGEIRDDITIRSLVAGPSRQVTS